MVELRKRKAAAVPTRAPPKKKPDPVQKAVEKAESPLAGEPGRAKNGSGPFAIGEAVPAEALSAEVETHSGEKVTLKKLVDDSKAGVALFTYPKASTPGCKSSNAIVESCLR